MLRSHCSRKRQLLAGSDDGKGSGDGQSGGVAGLAAGLADCREGDGDGDGDRQPGEVTAVAASEPLLTYGAAACWQ